MALESSCVGLVECFQEFSKLLHILLLQFLRIFLCSSCRVLQGMLRSSSCSSPLPSGGVASVELYQEFANTQCVHLSVSFLFPFSLELWAFPFAQLQYKTISIIVEILFLLLFNTYKVLWLISAGFLVISCSENI